MKCPSCGKTITRDMKVCCENCGDPIIKKDLGVITEDKIDYTESSNWDSVDQRIWVINKCRKLGVDPDHPDMVRKFKKEYYEEFGE
ncbi:MAG: hypothetical protein GY870_01275 [archaeon]|nr:hypothetical protein [archaeon]